MHCIILSQLNTQYWHGLHSGALTRSGIHRQYFWTWNCTFLKQDVLPIYCMAVKYGWSPETWLQNLELLLLPHVIGSCWTSNVLALALSYCVISCQLKFLGMPTFCAWRRMDQLTFYFVWAHPPLSPPPPHHEKKLPGRLHKYFSSQVQEWIDPNFFMTSCALPKTKPAGDDFQLTALWLTDDDESYLDFMEHFSARP